ncbi:MAG: ATP-binding protein, partial [Hyphomicrobiaceae bacterium]
MPRLKSQDVGNEAGHPSWQAMLDALSDPALVLDEAGTVVHHNPPVVDLYPRVNIGSDVTLLSREPALLAAIEKARLADERIVVPLHDRVPVIRRMSAIISRIDILRPTPGSPLILVVLRDLTDQESHAQMRADFIAHASHELRTPLASLRVIVETLLGPAREDPQKRERFLSMMLDQATRMAQLIDDLLSLSRVEMRAHVPPRGEVEVSDLLGTVVQSLEPLAESNGISLTLDNPLGQVFVRGEHEELAQVFQNLIQNAIRYGRDGGSAVVTVSRDIDRGARTSRIRIAVRDDGVGIAPEHIPRLTERFYRVSAVDSRAKGGTGLGLAIVKHIVTRHRG